MSAQRSAIQYEPNSDQLITVAVVRVQLPATEAAALMHRVPQGDKLGDYVAGLVGAVVSQEVAQGERALRALALEEAGHIEIGRASPQ